MARTERAASRWGRVVVVPVPHGPTPSAAAADRPRPPRGDAARRRARSLPHLFGRPARTARRAPAAPPPRREARLPDCRPHRRAGASCVAARSRRRTGGDRPTGTGVAGERVTDLSAREFALAEILMRNPDRVLSREQLLSQVWGFDYDPGSNIVDVYIRYLRRKIGADRVQTVRGVGYRLRV
ncbi:hypothetical protein SCALM49S_02639 [Streptomyces californicus]